MVSSTLVSFSRSRFRTDSLSLSLLFSRSHAVDCEWPGDEGVGACSNCFFSYSLVSLVGSCSSNFKRNLIPPSNLFFLFLPFVATVRSLDSTSTEPTLGQLLPLLPHPTTTQRRRTNTHSVSPTSSLPILLPVPFDFRLTLQITLVFE